MLIRLAGLPEFMTYLTRLTSTFFTKRWSRASYSMIGTRGPQAQGDPDVVRIEPPGAVEAVDRDDERHPVPLEVVDRAVGD